MGILENLLATYENDKSNPFLPYGIGIEYRNASDLENALKFFLIVKNDFPEYVPNYFHLGQTYESLDKIEDAKSAYKTGIEVAEKANDAHALSELRGALNIIE